MKEKTLHKDDKLKSRGESSLLILYNDDFNTFEHVIKSLVEVCGHDSVQAEQCAMIVHFKGSCEVKSGIPDVLYAMSRSLNAKGLNSKVEIL
jgi:ATP-dependent Clp protease adaptor protein ClpS